MKINFTNELTTEQIKQGVWAYVTKRFKFIRTAVILTVFFLVMMAWNFLDGTLYTQSTLVFIILYAIFMLLIIGLIAFSYSALYKQFRTEETTKYTITDTGLEIINLNGAQKNYVWRQMYKIIDYNDVYVIFLTRQTFCIISKIAIDEHIHEIEKKMKEVQNG